MVVLSTRYSAEPVVVVLVAVVEVLIPGVRAVDALSTSPDRRLAPIGGVTAPDLSCASAAVSVMRMAVALWASGETRFKLRTGMRALTVMLQAPCSRKT
jgi:hypothetical protein